MLSHRDVTWELCQPSSRLAGSGTSKPSVSWSIWALSSGFALVRGSGSEQAGPGVPRQPCSKAGLGKSFVGWHGIIGWEWGNHKVLSLAKG